MLGLVLIGSGFRASLNGLIKVSPQEAVRLMNDGALVVDIRPEDEYKKGHIKKAVHLPFTKVGPQAEKVLGRHKQKPLLVVDAHGYQEVAAGSMLAKQGFAPVHYLAGGLAAWQEAKLPLEKKHTWSLSLFIPPKSAHTVFAPRCFWSA